MSQCVMNIVNGLVGAILSAVYVGCLTDSTASSVCIDGDGRLDYETNEAVFRMQVLPSDTDRGLERVGNQYVLHTDSISFIYDIETKNSSSRSTVIVVRRTLIEITLTNQPDINEGTVDRLLRPPEQMCLPEWVLEERLLHTPFSRTFWQMPDFERGSWKRISVIVHQGSVPASWFTLLRVSSLEGLQVLGVDWPKPHALRGPMPALAHLFLSACGVVDLPDDFFIGTPALSKLVLLDNPLARLPRALALHTPLRELQVGGAGLSIPPEDIAPFQRLETLLVENTPLREDTASALLRLPRLRHLEITNCSFESFMRPLAPKTDGLDQLKIPGNKIFSLPPDFSAIRSIEYFDASYNAFNHCPFENLDNPMVISKLSLSHNEIDVLTKKCLLNLHNVVEFECSHNQIKSIEPNSFSHLQKLRKILLAYNFLTSIEPSTFFIQSKKKPLEVIKLTHNFLRNVTIVDNEASKFDLDVLDLASNNIENLEVPKTNWLDLTDTNRTEITPKFLDLVVNRSIEILPISSNPLQCCRHNQSTVERLLALQEKRIFFTNLNSTKLTCTLPDAGELTFEEFEEHREACFAAERARALAWSVAWAVQGSLALLVAVVIYRRRADLAYARAFFRVRRMDPEDSNRYATCVYDAFICYSSNITDWVTEEFVPTLESDERQYKFCVHHHDFTLGLPISENIMLAMKRSRKVIFVITQQFVESEWGAWELRLAAHHMLGSTKGYLLLVLLEDLDIDRLPHPLRLLLASRTIVRWPPADAPKKQSKRCYQRLVAALGDSLWQRTGKDPRRPGTVSDLT